MVSTELSPTKTGSCGKKGEAELRQGKGRGKTAPSAVLPAQPGRPSKQQFQVFIFVSLMSAHVEPSNRLNDPSVAIREDGGA